MPKCPECNDSYLYAPCATCGGTGHLRWRDLAAYWRREYVRVAANRDGCYASLVERHEAQTAALREVEAERDSLRARLDAQAAPTGTCPACEVARSCLYDIGREYGDAPWCARKANLALGAMDAAGPCRSTWRVVVRRPLSAGLYHAYLCAPGGEQELPSSVVTAEDMVSLLCRYFGVTPADIEVEGEVTP